MKLLYKHVNSAHTNYMRRLNVIRGTFSHVLPAIVCHSDMITTHETKKTCNKFKCDEANNLIHKSLHL